MRSYLILLACIHLLPSGAFAQTILDSRPLTDVKSGFIDVIATDFEDTVVLQQRNGSIFFVWNETPLKPLMNEINSHLEVVAAQPYALRPRLEGNFLSYLNSPGLYEANGQFVSSLTARGQQLSNDEKAIRSWAKSQSKIRLHYEYRLLRQLRLGADSSPTHTSCEYVVFPEVQFRVIESQSLLADLTIRPRFPTLSPIAYSRGESQEDCVKKLKHTVSAGK